MDYYHYPARKWGLGHNQLSTSLVSVEEQLYVTSKPFLLPPSAQPVNPYPVETMLLSGKVRGDGMMSSQWEWGFMPIPTFQAMMTWLFPDEEKAAPITIAERMPEIDEEYRRFNCWAVRPEPGRDYKIDGGRVVDLKLRFSGMRSLGDLAISAQTATFTNVLFPPGVFTGALEATLFVNAQSFGNAGIGIPVEPQKFTNLNVLRAPNVYNDRITPLLHVNPNSFGAASVAYAVEATLFVNTNSFGTAVIS